MKNPAPDPGLLDKFPDNPYIQRLLDKAAELNVTIARSPVHEQWLYHPDHRTLYVWEPDLDEESLSYLVVVLAHELGHVVDFDENPRRRAVTRYLHWSQVPDEIEIAAFVEGFHILKELSVPISLDDYTMMIEPPIAASVRERIESSVCCLLGDPTRPGSSQADAPKQAAG